VLYDLLYKTVLTRIDPELIHDVCLDAIEVTSNRAAWACSSAAIP